MHGIARIVKTNNFLVKLVWTFMIFISVSFGLYNISRTVNDYSKYHVITNIERVTPEEVTFPAITLCTDNSFFLVHYKNASLVASHRTNDIDLKNFIASYNSPNLDNNTANLESISFDSKKCVRFNGITDRSIETVKSTLDYLFLRIKTKFRKNVSDSEYIDYSLYSSSFYLYTTDNYLNYLLKSERLILSDKKDHTLKIEKPPILNLS